VRRWAVLLTLVALVAGCGDDDDSDSGSPATTATEETTATDATESRPPPEQSGPAPTKAELESCLGDADLELKPGSEAATNAKGESRTRKGLEGVEATYLGYVQWPSKRLADVYLAKDAAGADQTEDKAKGFVKAFGLDPAKYVRRAGAIVLLYDEPPPTAEESKAVEDCAG
jgi:hypothetical protein